MYQFSSGKKSGLEHAFVLCFAVGGVILYAVSGAEGVPFPFLFQTGAILLLAAFVYLLIRYELKQYRYELRDSGIRDSEGRVRYELVVTEQVGKKETVVARVGLWQIGRVEKLDKTGSAKKTFGVDKRVFIYDNRLFAPSRCGICMTGDDPVVVIPADERMMALLQNNHTEENPL